MESKNKIQLCLTDDVSSEQAARMWHEASPKEEDIMRVLTSLLGMSTRAARKLLEAETQKKTEHRALLEKTLE